MSNQRNDAAKESPLYQPRVFLVGAGPGDPGLLTLRGQQLLQRADVIVYDYLASASLLRWARPEAELIYVGKKAGRHSMPQEQINQLLVEKGRQFSTVVRLKGGDPYIFGRGGEEALALTEAGIAFQVVPGVTAGVAAAAYAGIPATHRDFASELALVTGHEDADRIDESQIDWEALGRWRGTIVFYMGVKNLPVICGQLQQHGLSRETPGAVVSWGATPRQRCVTGTLGTLPDLAVQHQIAPPALIIVGKVVTLREQLNWYERLPLFGQRIMVTRSRTQASELSEQLTELGAEVLEFPTIRIEPADDVQPLRNAVNRVRDYHWLIFTSVNGVEAFFEMLFAEGHDARCLAAAQICAIGPATADRLRAQGIVAELVPPQFVAESIVEALSHTDDLRGRRILLARSDIARGELPKALAQLGAVVDDVVAYRTRPDDSPKDDLVGALDENRVDWITFASSSTVRNFISCVGLERLQGKKFRVASIGPITTATIKQVGLNVDVEAQEYTIPGLVRSVCWACST